MSSGATNTFDGIPPPGSEPRESLEPNGNARKTGNPASRAEPRHQNAAISARDIASALGCKTPPDARGNYQCRCPGPLHRRGDRNPSLSVKDGRNGRPLLYCHVGCEFADIVAVLTQRGLWPNFSEGQWG
jgi:hypothetical protein